MIKIISFKGGLGNQIFEYFFYQYLRNNTNQKIYGYYNRDWLKDHNGLEIQKVFDINLPKASNLSNFTVFIIRLINKFNPQNSFTSNDGRLKLSAIYFDGWWQNKMFYKDLDKSIGFKKIDLNETNSKLLDNILNSNSVSLHVRRGDYLQKKYVGKYGNVCTLSYYKKAIELIENSFENPVFFVFSDDIDWVKNNFILENKVFVSENYGEKSFLDMYLMTFCKANIIANSSFSYWGALLNKSDNKVIYPKKWYNSNDVVPNIFKSCWIGI